MASASTSNTQGSPCGPWFVDMHSDILFDVTKKRRAGYKGVIPRDYLPSMKAGGIDAVLMALYVDDTFLPEMALREALDMVSHLYQEAEECPDLAICRNYQEMARAKAAGRVALILSMEGVEPLLGDIDLLYVFHELGLRCLSLTHSRVNAAADGAPYGRADGRGRGISDFGQKVVELAEALGIIIDLSHLNEAGFWDVLDVATKPVILSHSNARSIWPSLRNVSDEQILAVAKTGGITGIATPNLMVHEETPEVETFIDHIHYVASLAGASHVGLGFDFCDYLTPHLSGADRRRVPPFFSVRGLSDYSQAPTIPKMLRAQGYGDEDVVGILGGNFLRVFRAVTSRTETR